MRICYLSADLGIPLGGSKGASAHVRGLVQALAELGHEVAVLTPAADGWAPAGIEVIPLPEPVLAARFPAETNRRMARALGHLWNNVTVEEAVRRVLTRRRPDIVYERYSPFGVAGALAAHGLDVPHLLEVNAPLAWEGVRYRKQALSEAAEFLERAAFDATSLVLAVSCELKALLLAAGLPAEKVEVVPNGVDAALFAPEGEAARDGLDGKVVVGFVGSLKPWHGVELLAEAFRGLAADPRFHLLVVGNGPLAGAVGDLARDLPGRVTHVGAVPHDHVPRYVRAMDVAVVPYPPFEPFYFSPLKVLEYMAAGRAVVASRIGQLAELVRDGETGVLVPPGDAAALAGAIERLARDPGLRRALGRAAAEDVRRGHLWTHRATRILGLAERLS